jgi:hypothetical protein
MAMEWMSMPTSKFWSITKNEIFIPKLVIFMIAVATASLVFRSDIDVAHRPVQEDGYYAFTVARNVALGKGITIDGSTLTNGFQPLFTFLSVPAFMLAGDEKYLAIRYVLVMHWFFLLGTAFILGLIARDALEENPSVKNLTVFWWVFLLYCSSVLVFVLNFNGLETGFLLFSYALAWRYYQIVPTERWGRLIFFGVLLGLIVLARIDAVILVLVASLSQLVLHRQLSLWVRFRRFITVSGIALLVSSPWWLYNVAFFGSPMPTSGRAYQTWVVPTARIAEALVALFRSTVPMIYVGQNTRFEGIVATLLRIGLTVAALVYLLKRRHDFFGTSVHDGAPNPVTKRTLEFGAILLVSNTILIISYTSVFSATWFYTRYFAPMVLISILCIGYVLVRVGKKVPLVMNTLALGLGVALLLVIYSLHSGQIQNQFINHQLPLINADVPAEAKVASFQTGTLGYFRDNVVNLDGKVNPKAIEYRGNLLSYLRENRIAWLCDEQSSLEGILGKKDLEQNGWKVVGKSGQFALYHSQYAQ